MTILPISPKVGRPIIDILNQTFGHLQVLSLYGRTPHGNGAESLWLCRCDCGNTCVVRGYALRTGRRWHCGCIRPNIKHGMSGTPELSVYDSAKSRCNNSLSKSYPNYGGRGLTFEFESYEQWADELGEKPGPEYSVDRIDNNVGYVSGNIRWATSAEQAANKRCPCSRCDDLVGHAP